MFGAGNGGRTANLEKVTGGYLVRLQRGHDEAGGRQMQDLQEQIPEVLGGMVKALQGGSEFPEGQPGVKPVVAPPRKNQDTAVFVELTEAIAACQKFMDRGLLPCDVETTGLAENE
jgi:hypothetical protein